MNEWNYDMEAAPKGPTLVLSIDDGEGGYILLGYKNPEGVITHDLHTLAIAGVYAWMELSPAPLPEIPE